MKNKLLQVAKIGRPHGRFGEVRLHLFNQNLDILAPNTRFFLNGDLDNFITLDSVRPADKFFLAKFDGYDYRDQTQELTNAVLYLDRDSLPEPDEDEFYCADLIGFTVRAQRTDKIDDSSACIDLGKVVAFLDNVQTDCMVIEGPRLRTRWLVPFISSVVLSVDLDAESIELAPLDQWTHEDQVLLD